MTDDITALQAARAKHMSLLEVQACIILDASRAKDGTQDRDVDQWGRRQIIRTVFTAMYANALDVGRICDIGRALTGHNIDPAPMREALTRLVREGTLRSLRNYDTGNVRLYEINFPA